MSKLRVLLSLPPRASAHLTRRLRKQSKKVWKKVVKIVRWSPVTRSLIRIETRGRRVVNQVIRDVSKRCGGVRQRSIKRLGATPYGQRILTVALRVRYPGEALHRRQAGRRLAGSAALQIDRGPGYRSVAAGELPGTSGLIRMCHDLYESDERNERFNESENVILRDLFDDDLLDNEPAVVDFALQQQLLSTVARYLAARGERAVS